MTDPVAPEPMNQDYPATAELKREALVALGRIAGGPPELDEDEALDPEYEKQRRQDWETIRKALMLLPD